MTSRFPSVSSLSLALLLLCACGGSGSNTDDADGGGGSSEGGLLGDAGGDPDAAAVNGGAQYAISGTLSGLGPGQSITITDNASDPLTLTANGAFTFAKKVQYNKGYSVTITTTPENQDCAVMSAAGTVTKAVTNVAVTCSTIAPKMFLVSGKGGAPGDVDGTGPAARFLAPTALTVDATGNVYVADTGNNIIRKISPAGVVVTVAGTAGQNGTADGVGAAARFSAPSGIAVDVAGTVYVSDSGNYTIRAITTAGAVTTIAGTAGQPGNVSANGAAARFSKPLGMFATGGSLYVADRDNAAVRQITLGGASPPVGNLQTGISTPLDVTYDPGTGKFFEVDAAQLIYTINTAILAGQANTPGYLNATGSGARFDGPSAIAVSGGVMYVADTLNQVIRSIVLSTAAVGTFAGTPNVSGALDGFKGQSLFNAPKGVAVDAAGNVYVADTGNNVIRKISGGSVTTFAGSLSGRGAADGAGSVARFNTPLGVATDATGNLFVGDSVNHTIRKVVPGGAVSTFAGTVGVPGKVNDTGTAASFNGPSALAFDKSGNLYVADELNCAIRKVTSAGVVSSFVDPGGCPAFGDPPLVKFTPRGVAVDSVGNVFFTDNFASAVWKVTPAGVATPFAGGAQGNADGKGLGANFNFVSQLTIDASDNLYLADTGNSAVRKITPAADITTLAFSGGDPLNSPLGIAIDRTGTIFVSDVLRGFVVARKADGTAATVLGAPNKHGLQVGAPPGFLSGPAGVAIFGTNVFVVDSIENALVQVTNLAY